MQQTGAGQPRRIDWRAASAGLLVAVVIQLAGSALLLGVGRVAGTGLLTFSALVLGGVIAGLLGPAAGSTWNGMVVGIGYVLVTALVPGSSDMTGLIVGDLVVLSGGTLGGWLSGRARALGRR